MSGRGGRDECYLGKCLRALQAAPAPTASADCLSFQQTPPSASSYVDLIPIYAAPCRNSHRYSSACSCLGVTTREEVWGTTTTTETVLWGSTPTATEDAEVDGQWQGAWQDDNDVDGKQFKIKARQADRRVLKLDETLDLDALCWKKVQEALDGVAGEVEAVQADEITVTSVRVSTVTVTKMTTMTAKGTVTVAASCSSTTPRALLANAAAAVMAAPTATALMAPANCLKDAVASAIVAGLKGLLVNEDKKEVDIVARELLAEEFMSVNEKDAENTTYPDLESFLAFLASTPAIAEVTTLDVFHDCNRIVWYWAASGARVEGGDEVRGVALLYTIERRMADMSDGVVDDILGKVLKDGYGARKVNTLIFDFQSLGW